MNTPRSTCSTESCSTRYGPMRQYDSGGSTVWSLIQPLPGVCSSGWLRKKLNRPPGRTHAGHLVDRAVHVVDVLEHETRHRGVERRVGERQLGRARSHVRRSAAALPRHADLVPRRIDARRRPTPAPASIRLICPSPQPMSSTRSKPDSSASAIGRICSSYSGSAPSVNPSIHQSAWLSHRSSSSPASDRRSRRRGYDR